MLAVQPRAYVYLPNELCLSKSDFDGYLGTLQATPIDVLQRLLLMAWNPKNHTVSPQDLFVLRQWNYLDSQYQVPHTVKEILKTCFDWPHFQWTLKGVRVEVIYPPILKVPEPVQTSPTFSSKSSSPCIDDPKNSKSIPSTPVLKVSTPKVRGSEGEAELLLPPSEEPIQFDLNAPALPKVVEAPSLKELHELIRKIKGTSPLLQETIEKGGLFWHVVSDDRNFYSYSRHFKEGPLKVLLCQIALENQDEELLSVILPHLSQQEISERIELNTPRTILTTKGGLKLLESYEKARQYLIREAFPHGQVYNIRSIGQIDFVQKLLAPLEIRAILDQKIDTSLFNELFLLRMERPSYKDWCIKALKSPASKHLIASAIIERLLKMPPSKDRSELALYTTVCLNYLHPSLKEKPFCFQEPDASSQDIRAFLKEEVDHYLEKESLAGRYESVRLIRDNFAFLLVNKKGLCFINVHLDGNHIRRCKAEFKQLVASLETREEPTQPQYEPRRTAKIRWRN